MQLTIYLSVDLSTEGGQAFNFILATCNLELSTCKQINPSTPLCGTGKSSIVNLQSQIINQKSTI